MKTNLPFLLASLRFLSALALGAVVTVKLGAAAIPPDRLPPAGKWSPGIPGGIPANYTQFCNVRQSIPSTSLVAAGDGITDDTAAINAALAACPNGKYVYLPQGNYRCDSSISRQGTYRYDGVQHHFSVLLKGDGPDKTKIYSYSSGDCISFSPGLGPVGGGTIISGNTRGSTSITVPLSSPGAFAAGNWIRILRKNTEAADGHQGSYMDDTCSIFVRVTSITGSGPYTIGFTPALNDGYPSDVVGMAMSVPYRCGIQDLYIERMTNTSGHNIRFMGAQECWIKNVESNNARKWHIRLEWSAGCEVRECYVHDGWDAGGDADYGYGLFEYSCNNLIENNIAVRCRHSMVMEYGGQNNVFAYNYSKDPINNDKGPGKDNQLLTDYLMEDMFLNHGGSPRWNLYEGNVVAKIAGDYLFGGMNDNTAFRSLVQRKGLPTTYVACNAADIERWNYSVNLVGLVYELPPPSAPTTPEYRWGSSGDDMSSPDPQSQSTAYIHGVYSMQNATTTWDPHNSDHTLPNSYYLSAKPSWWDSGPWPAIGPDRSPTNGGNPAMRRWSQRSAQGPSNAITTITVQ